MSDSPSNDRLIKNEQTLRDKNTAAGKAIKNYFRGDSEVKNTPIAFVCECSRLDCDEHVNTSIKLYEKLHKRNDRFTIFPGHDTPKVENIVDRHDDFDIVEKPALDS